MRPRQRGAPPRLAGLLCDATMNRLVAEAGFTGDRTIFEFACGTGPLSR